MGFQTEFISFLLQSHPFLVLKRIWFAPFTGTLDILHHSYVTEKLSALKLVEVERACKFVGERRLPTFHTVTSDGTAYFNKVLRDISRLY